MPAIFQKITSLTEVDFDSLFAASFDRIDGNFVWLTPDITYDEKKQIYKDQLQMGIDGTWPLKSSTDVFFMYKIVLDGIDSELLAGFIEDGNCLTGRWNLNSADSSGSRNWLYRADTRAARAAFFNEHNILYHKYPTYVGSDLYKLIKNRATSGHYTIIEEFLTNIPSQISMHFQKTFVTLKVQMN